jgi:hypothetical protein
VDMCGDGSTSAQPVCFPTAEVLDEFTDVYSAVIRLRTADGRRGDLDKPLENGLRIGIEVWGGMLQC